MSLKDTVIGSVGAPESAASATTGTGAAWNAELVRFFVFVAAFGAAFDVVLDVIFDVDFATDFVRLDVEAEVVAILRFREEKA